MKNKMENFVRWLHKNSYRGENTQIYEFEKSGSVPLSTTGLYSLTLHSLIEPDKGEVFRH